MKAYEALSGYSDHFPFFLMGAPSINLRRPLDQFAKGLSHTKADTFDKVNFKDMKEATLVVARLVMRAANEPERIAKHKSWEEIKGGVKGEEGQCPEAVVLQRGEGRENSCLGENRREQYFLVFRESDFRFFINSMFFHSFLFCLFY